MSRSAKSKYRHVIPPDEFLNANAAWRSALESWQCPACQRKKRDVIQLSNAGVWSAHLVRHHDHRSDFNLPPRFKPTLICQPCNHVDANFKAIANVPPEFSLSAQEIAACLISVKANEAHGVDYRIAERICQSYVQEFGKIETKPANDDDGWFDKIIIRSAS